jgi:hypothetical protein
MDVMTMDRRELADFLRRAVNGSPRRRPVCPRGHAAAPLRLVHPEAGPMELDFEVLLTPADDQQVRLFTPPPGSPTLDALELLKTVGPETVHRRHRR